jgi:predicted esterase
MGWSLFATGGLALAARARADTSSAGRWLKVGTEERPAIVYAPALEADDKKPVITMLHGMCDTPENECERFHPAATNAGFLLCPRANGACGNGGAIWRGSPESKRALVDDSLSALSTEFGSSATTDHDGTLIGFSQGAYLAVDMIKRSKGPWSSMILIGASIDIDARSLREAGIRRVLLAAGDYDGARPSMQHATAALVQAGFDAKFTSLGPVGHQFAFDMNAWMKDALAWVRQ